MMTTKRDEYRDAIHEAIMKIARKDGDDDAHVYISDVIDGLIFNMATLLSDEDDDRQLWCIAQFMLQVSIMRGER